MCGRFRTFASLFLLIALVAKVEGKSENLKICVVGNPRVKTTRTTKYCDLLERSKGSPVTCVFEEDRIGCMRAVSRRKADFSVFEPEDLYFATLLDETWILVASEIKSLKNSPFHHGTVAVVRKSANITGIKDLQGKRLCHPGLESGSDWSPLFVQYFEERIAPANCEEELTIYEDRIKTTSGFLGSACKAGPWVVDPKEDARLKKKYWNLCSLCESGDCGVEEKYRGSGGSIMCFKDGLGDVLWARYDEVKLHLQPSAGDASDYAFLCDDGTLMAITSDKPCIWLAKPWQVVGANRKSAANVQKVLESLRNEEHGSWEENLLHLIELYMKYVQNLMVLRTPEDYLRSIPGYLSASSMSEGNCNPKHSVKLCASTFEELVKCSWMSKAASALAIQPSLECVRKVNFTDCLNSVAETETDVVAVPPDFLHDARLKFNLRTFLVESGSQFNASHLVSAVVKKNSNVKNVADLKGKRVCFSRRNGIGWNGAVTVLHQEKWIDSECGGREGLSEFFGDVCVMGKDVAEDGDLAGCCHGSSDLGNDELSVLRCLEQDGCDVAFSDLSSLRGKTEGGKISGEELEAVCREDKPTECHWAWGYPNYLMYSSRIARSKAEEAYGVFFQIGQVFGRNSRKNNPMLKVFGPFNGANNILFRDSSAAFVSSDHWNHSNNYGEIVERLKLCSGSSQIWASSKSLFPLLLLVLFSINLSSSFFL